MRANNYDTGSRFTTTKDYFKIENALRLADYSVMFVQIPWISYVTPFVNWDGSAPTKSLPWYDAYNMVKHDRDENFKLGSMKNAMSALAALYVVIGAQFGFHDLQYMGDFRDLYRLETMPAWTVGDTHGSPDVLALGLPVDYPF